MTYAAIASSILCAIAFVTSGTAWGADPIGAGTIAKINEVAAACAAEPMRGTVYYYCDCGTGADANCVPGSDTNAGTDPAAPRRTISDAVTRYNGLSGTNTIAFCKGGAFDATPTNWLSLNNSTCAAGTTCNDFREYAPTTFNNHAAPIAKPIINTVATNTTTFGVTGNKGGIRFLNLSLRGSTGGATNGRHAFFLYRGAHDVTMCNLDMDAFDMPVYNESGGDGDALTTNIRLTGSNITNSRVIGYLGGGDNAEISYNNWDGNGSSNVFDHTIYLASSKNVLNMQVVGNYIHGQYGPTCLGSVMIAHASIDGLLVKDNTIVLEASQTAPGCWGIGFNNHTNATHAQYYRNAVFSGNTVINGGNLGFTVSSCPGCVIENNLVIQNWASGGGTGISVPGYGVNAARGDDVNTANVIRNNTVWFGPNTTGTSTGIDVNIEGTDYIVANNTVSSAQTAGTVNCFRYRLPLASFAFINNNHCHATVSNRWETTQGTLAAWKTYAAGYGFDSASFIGDPLLVAPGSDFSPTSGSPLVGAGSQARGAKLDLAGQIRPIPPAIGAFERQGPGTISVKNTTKVSEGAASALVQVMRTGGTTGAIGIDYATGNGTALAGTDYTTTSGTLAWADGDGSAKFISVPVLHDATTEPAKAFHVTLANPTGTATLGNSVVAVTIFDDDPATPFLDTANSSFLTYINSIYGAGITTGCGNGNYCPSQSVTRAQMAAFLIRALEGNPVAGYCGATAPFADVALSNTFCGHIKRLKELNVTTGCGNGNYCPNNNVSREQMAALIVRAGEGEPSPTYCITGSPFADVPQSNSFCRYIKRLAESGITTGCGGGNFCPAQLVTREQMAAFIARAFLRM